jgi:hypothetical protein
MADHSITVELSREEVQQALAAAGAVKAGVACSYAHKVSIRGSWMCLEDNPVAVEITPLPNLNRMPERGEHG